MVLLLVHVLEAWGIGPGDEVITTPLTMSSTTFCILQATEVASVYADIEADTFNIDPKSIKEKINSNTKLLSQFQFFGLSPNARRDNAYCKK